MEPIAAVSQPPQPKRRFRVRPLWLLVGFVFCGLVAVLVLFFRGRSQVGAIQVRLDADEPGWRMADLWADYQRTLPRDDQNAFRVVDAASRAIPPSFVAWSQKPDALVAAVREEEAEAATGVPPQALEECRVQLKPARAALDIAHTLRSFKGLGGAPTVLAVDGIGTLLPHLDTARRVCDLLECEGTLAARAHDPERAVLAAICCVQAGRSLGDEPFFITQLIRMHGSHAAVSVAERALAQNVVREELLAELQERLSAERDPARFLSTMKMERATLNQLFDNFRTGKDTVRAFVARYGMNVTGPVEMHSALFAVQEGGDHLAALENANQLVEIARLPEEERLERSRQLPPLAERRSLVFKLLVGMVGGSPAKMVELDLLRHAQLRCGIAAIACERFRMRTGAWPKSLAELPEGLLPVGLKDPFTGGPLHFKFEDGGAVVYSVGPDGEDNDGKLAFSRAVPTGRDVGFRLVDPRKRTRE